MVRFRIGQVWKREGLGRPVDAFGLELDGVDLLAGANEEPLDRVVTDLLDALLALETGEARLAELSLPEAHLELLLRRRGDEVELRVAHLGRPARIQRGPLRVDLRDLSEAAVRCARALLLDLRETAPDRNEARLRKMSSLAARLDDAHFAELEEGPPPGGFELRAAPPGEIAFAFELEDPDDLLSEWTGGQGPLTSLSCGGGLSLRIVGRELWRGRGVPFLMALELARQAAELVHAIELEEDSARLTFGGVGPEVDIDFRNGAVRTPDETVHVRPPALIRAMFDLGPALELAITGRHRAQRKNPWLTGLVERCREGLSRLGAGIQPPEDLRPARVKKGSTRAAATRPLRTEGKLRRLRFDKRWEKQNLTSDGPGAIALGRKGPVILSPHLACGFSARGELLFRRVGSHGVAANAEGEAVVASSSQVLLFRGADASARWLRDHDGLQLGPELIHRDGVLVVSCQGRGAAGFSAMTGRELWRLVPPRTQRCWISVQAHRALVADDTGHLYGLDLESGQVRFRMRAALPFTGPTVPWGRRMLATIGRGGHSSLLAADAHSGAMIWSHELPHGAISRPLVLSRRIYLATGDAREGRLICLGANGRALWERRIHLGEPPWSLTETGGGVLVWSRNGAAALFSVDGSPEWRLGAAGAELPATLTPCQSRGVLIVPGEVTRAVDPRGGRVLAELRTGLGLCDLEADARLNVYALDEDGTLTAWKLSTSFAVV